MSDKGWFRHELGRNRARRRRRLWPAVGRIGSASVEVALVEFALVEFALISVDFGPDVVQVGPMLARLRRTSASFGPKPSKSSPMSAAWSVRHFVNTRPLLARIRARRGADGANLCGGAEFEGPEPPRP